MAVKFSLADNENLEIEDEFLKMYERLGLEPEVARAKVERYKEYIFRLKGLNPIADGLVDYISEEMFWLGAFIVKTKPDTVVYDENAPEEDEDEEDEPDIVQPGNRDDYDNDTMFG